MGVYIKGGENMGKAEEIIKNVLSDKKLSESKIYRDEPLIFTASQMKSYTPPEYGKMQRMISSRDGLFMPSAQIFCKQGKFMEKFEDCFDRPVSCTRHFPTYRDMSIPQLRSYFSWRTAVRQGEIKATSLSYAFVYIYELINLIGVPSPEEGFLRLKDFCEKYAPLDMRIKPYTDRWITDFAAYYELPASLTESLYGLKNDSALLCLMNYKSEAPQSVLAALDCFSSYCLKNSSFYKKHPDETAETVYRLFCSLADYYDGRTGGDIFIRLFAKPVRERYFMFRSAVFFEKRPHPDCKYKVNDIFSYSCKNGEWTVTRFFPVKDKAGKIGALLKTTDYYLRLRYGYKSPLKKAEVSADFEQLIKNAVNAQYKDKIEREKPVISIDTSKLQGIRDTAEVTRDKLIVEEEPEDLPAPEPPAKEEPSNSGILRPPLKEILIAIIRGENAETVARKSGVMLSVAVEEINETLFDDFGDTVIDFDGDTPIIIEDYENELKGMFNL
ncbi:MAG: TerB N-terminal domain-containing protein [Acutalibacteraceae bacterium]